MFLKKKGQITFFIILGIILLGAAILVFFTAGREEVEQRDVEQIADELFRSADVQRFVQNCLDFAVTDSVALIGEQGGNILAEQPGNVYEGLPTRVQPKTTDNITHLIRKRRFIRGGEQYPSQNFEENGTPTYLGESAIPSLRKTEGPFSWQEQIETYVHNRTTNCLNFTQFNKEVQAGNITVNTSINANDVSTEIQVQVVIEGNPVRELTGFQSKTRIRLQRIHEFLQDIITQDNSLLLFNMSKDYNESSYWDSGVNLTVEEINESIDKIILEDYFSNLQGQSYKFQFIRENRIPVLSYIPEKQTVSGKVTMTAEAYDPDEDSMTYSINDTEWEQTDNSFRSPEVGSCPNFRCVANLSVQDLEGLKDWQKILATKF